MECLTPENENCIDSLNGTAVFDPDILEKVKAIFDDNHIHKPSWIVWTEPMLRACLEEHGESIEYIENLCNKIKAGEHDTIIFNVPIPIEGK